MEYFINFNIFKQSHSILIYYKIHVSLFLLLSGLNFNVSYLSFSLFLVLMFDVLLAYLSNDINYGDYKDFVKFYKISNFF